MGAWPFGKTGGVGAKTLPDAKQAKGGSTVIPAQNKPQPGKKLSGKKTVPPLKKKATTSTIGTTSTRASTQGSPPRIAGPTAINSVKKVKAPINKYPTYWTDTSASSRVPCSDKVISAVQEMMDGTWKDKITVDRGLRTCGDTTKVCKYEVVNVLRNENPVMWRKYVKKRNRLRVNHDPKYGYNVIHPKTSRYIDKMRAAGVTEPLCEAENEMILFHGTTPSAAEAICNNHYKLSNAPGLFGQGIYFAEASSKSDEYVQEDDNPIYSGLYATILSRVYMGRVRYDANLYPDGNALEYNAKMGYYNGTVGDREKTRGTYREFVIYHKYQAYPEYIVIYRRLDTSSSGRSITTVTTAATDSPGSGRSSVVEDFEGEYNLLE